MGATAASRRWYRDALSGCIDALVLARRRWGEAGQPSVAAAARRVARSLRGTGIEKESPEIAAAIAAVERADDSTLGARLDELLELVLPWRGATGGEVVLLVRGDDDGDGIRAALEAGGLEVRSVATVSEAERVLEAATVSLVLLDLALPDADGRELLLAIRQRRALAALPVLVLGTGAGVEAQWECLALGAEAVVFPPYDAEHIALLVSAQLRRAATVAWESRRDGLTGLPNRAAFRDAYERTAALAWRQKEPLSVGILRLERLGDTGAAIAPGARDEVIRAGARILGDSFRRSDLLARWSGDEFAVLLPATDEDGATLALEKALTRLRSSPVLVGRKEVSLSFSAGVTRAWERAPLDEVMSRAMRFLQEARRGGGDQVRSSRDRVTHRMIRIQRAHLDQLVEEVPEAIVITDAHGRVVRVNREFSTIFGYSREEALGRTLTSLIGKDGEGGDAEDLTRRVVAGETLDYEAVRRRKDGAPVDVSILAMPIPIDDEIAVCTIYRDITERKRAEAEILRAKAAAEAASRAMGERLSRMTREVKSPLDSVISFTEGLLKNEGGHLRAEELERLERLRASAKRILGVIDDLSQPSEANGDRRVMEGLPAMLGG